MAYLSEHYLLIRNLHVLTAILNIGLFISRYTLLSTRPGQPLNRWLRVLPHLNDTALLALAVLLCFITAQAPLRTPWLSEKVLAVIAYILAGMFALKWAKKPTARAISFIIALLLFAYAAAIAVNKNPVVF